MKLMTNNPAKFEALRSYGISVKSRVPVLCPITIVSSNIFGLSLFHWAHCQFDDFFMVNCRITNDIWKQKERKWAIYMHLIFLIYLVKSPQK